MVKINKDAQIGNTGYTLANAIDISDSGNTYIKFRDGTLIYYGLYHALTTLPPANGTSITINLSTTFKNSNYTVVLTKVDGGNNYTATKEVANNRTTSSFDIGMWNDSSNNSETWGYFYICIGKWK